jgi:hypothetical protein
MLSIKVLFIHQDDDLNRFAEEYQQGWPDLGGQLRHDFILRNTLGLVLAHPAPKQGAHRYIAFIDSRADRAAKAYFTAWHEIAHLLLQPPQLSFSGFRRITVDIAMTKDPIEALVDQVAGELAFYDSFLRPEYERELKGAGRLTLDGIGRVRLAVAPEASFSSTAHALVRMSGIPMAFLVADMQLKPSEARALASAQLALLEGRVPEERLRVVSVFPNNCASAAGFAIFRHMRVPAASVIAQVYSGGLQGSVLQSENQNDWESGGYNLASLDLQIEARKFGSVVYALVTAA